MSTYENLLTGKKVERVVVFLNWLSTKNGILVLIRRGFEGTVYAIRLQFGYN